MATLYHTTTGRLLRSVDTTAFLPGLAKPFPRRSGDYLINPDLSAVVDVPPRYWKVVGDTLQPMRQAERDAVDQARADAQTAEERAQAKLELERKTLKAFALTLLDEINLLRSQHALPERTAQQLQTALENKVDSI